MANNTKIYLNNCEWRRHNRCERQNRWREQQFALIMEKDLIFADQFCAIAPYYDEVMATVPYRHWVKYLKKIFKRYTWKPQQILEVATGTGTVALLLAEEGYRITGIDIAEGMIDVAKKKALANESVIKPTFLCCDATKLDFSMQFDTAICLFDSFNYILSAHDLKQAFAGVYRALSPGGAFIFDLNSEYALAANLFTQDNYWDDAAKVKHLWTARYNDKTRVATINMQFYLPDGKAFREVHKERAHRHSDVIRYLHEVGFEFLDAYDEYSFLPIGRRSERIFYVARRP
jgi:ubiquinone/menaquinone biosynthesis C-methylase UbiE